nr:hypothetical protein Iba_chr05aCG12190 [Ipomoea batatas]
MGKKICLQIRIWISRDRKLMREDILFLWLLLCLSSFNMLISTDPLDTPDMSSSRKIPPCVTLPSFIGTDMTSANYSFDSYSTLAGVHLGLAMSKLWVY